MTSSGDHRSRPLLAVVVAVGLMILGGAVTLVPAARPAAGAGGTGYFVTLAARSCPTYADVRANRARNNIQESLEDLGPDTNYVAGEAVSAAKEAAPPQSACTPLTNWQFTTGTGIQGGVTGPWGSLSRVTGTGRALGPTQASVPLLNPDGTASGSTLAGAVTVELTAAEFQQTSSRLWVQGGTPTDPVLNTPFPGQYGFAALRCAVDNLNGDNVEYIAYPQGVKSVLCYAYYVTPPPTSGTIVVRKQVTSTIPGFAPTQSFAFEGDISYTTDQRFNVDVVNGNPGQVTFFRAGGITWNFAELVPDGWTLTGISCAVVGGHGSVATTNLGAASVAVALRAGDQVTCTYVDDLPPPPTLRVLKITEGGTGSFDITAAGTLGTANGTATTTISDVADQIDLSAAGDGPYTLTEAAAAGTTGHWVLTAIQCDGATVALPADPTLPITGLAVPGNPSECTLTNRLDPPASLTVRKKIVGATQTVAFAISSVGSLAGYLQAADVTSENTFYTAVPFSPEDDTSNLPYGRYVVQELSGSADLTNFDVITAVSCNGAPVTPDATGAWQVDLQPGPSATTTCDVTDTVTPIATTTTTLPPTTTTLSPPATAPPVGPDAGAAHAAAAGSPMARTGGDLQGLPLGVALVATGLGVLVITRPRHRYP
jgi:hypothetical protein